MLTVLTRLAAVVLTVAVAACATTPPPADFSAPPRKQTDAKTQLESGRRT
ncbi:hypothetical protein [Microvirga antarctica]|nr:hypothetical protein [Microvirga antarctica]